MLNKNIDSVRYTLKFLQYSWNKCTMEILVSIMRFTFYDYYLNQASVQDLVKLFENFVINYICIFVYVLFIDEKQNYVKILRNRNIIRRRNFLKRSITSSSIVKLSQVSRSKILLLEFSFLFDMTYL